ncbi:hypothetical protein HDU97_006522 [Phlyctochytrium planicorne]|nr:hypothetical protein HDU97_006522 [Phlyctochytrium planicorne]
MPSTPSTPPALPSKPSPTRKIPPPPSPKPSSLISSSACPSPSPQPPKKYRPASQSDVAEGTDIIRSRPVSVRDEPELRDDEQEREKETPASSAVSVKSGVKVQSRLRNVSGNALESFVEEGEEVVVEVDEDGDGDVGGKREVLFSNETLAVGSSEGLDGEGEVKKKEVKVKEGLEVAVVEKEKPVYKFKTGVGRKRRSKLYVEFRNWMVNDGPTHIFLALWILVNLLLFLFTYLYYASTPDFRTFRYYLGPTLGVARGAAACLNLSCGIILVPVCRNLISLLRGSIVSKIVPFDQNIEFHRIVGMTVCWWTFVHVVAHMFNFQNFSRSHNFLVTPETLALLSGPGATGQLMVLLLFLITTSSLSAVRRKQFEQFWITHHLIVIFFTLLLLHGTFCFIQSDTGDACKGANFWKYFVGFGSVYGLERIVRAARARVPTKVTKVVQHPCGVVEVQIRKRWWRMRSGQYIFLNCSELSRYEWHPFTLTSAPEEDFLSVHIRVAGDWTKAFASRLGCNWEEEEKAKKKGRGDRKGGEAKKEEPKKEGATEEKQDEPKKDGSQEKHEEPKPGMKKEEEKTEENKKKDGPILGKEAELMLPRVMVDGPYGAASEDVFNYQVSVCIGAGIGVTPFASILKSLWYKILNPTKEIALQKVYFIWICRDKDSFEWFQDLLQALEQEHIDAFLSIQIYYTGTLSEEEVSNILLNQSENSDALTGLRSPTIYGRPNLEEMFGKWNAEHPDQDVGVFFCGPKVLGKRILKCCNRFTSVDEDAQTCNTPTSTLLNRMETTSNNSASISNNNGRNGRERNGGCCTVCPVRLANIFFFRRNRVQTTNPTVAAENNTQLQNLNIPPLSNILIVDDDQVVSAILARMLININPTCHIDTCLNGAEAVQKCLSGERTYQVVFMDLSMPVMDGFQATQEIRNKGLRVPIVAASTQQLPTDDHASLGFDGYVPKPFNPYLLKEELARLRLVSEINAAA